MLPQSFRLRLRQEKNFFSTAMVRSTLAFRWYIRPVVGNHPQITFVVGKQVEKRATRRNWVKRIATQAVFPLLPKLGSSQIVGVAGKRALNTHDVYESISVLNNQVCQSLSKI